MKYENHGNYGWSGPLCAGSGLIPCNDRNAGTTERKVTITGPHMDRESGEGKAMIGPDTKGIRHV